MSGQSRPSYLCQGESARLFPVLSTTSKEGRTTSIVLACMSKIDEFGHALLASVGRPLGKRAKLDVYTEIVFEKPKTEIRERPDGLIVVTVGSREWRALLETKIGNNELDPQQIERYRSLAKEFDIDCVITISNQFATTPDAHPVEAVRKSKSKIPVFHWSWMHILTTADLLISAKGVADEDQRILLNELRRFLTHESAGIRGFDRMPREWTELNKLVTSGGAIPAKSPIALPVLEAWHQETRDLSLILSRLTGTAVTEKLPRRHIKDPSERQKAELQLLRDAGQLTSELLIPDAASPLLVVADLKRRCIDVGMTLRAPEDRKSTKARLNWLLRQIKTERAEGYFLRLLWPGSADSTQFALADLRADIEIASEGKAHLVVSRFFVFQSSELGGRFGQQQNFIAELERLVPEFYRNLGSGLSAWQRPAPKIQEARATNKDVDRHALAEDAEGFEAKD
ncbi:hypothetical protein [Pararhodobacter oceanensis]|uniref:Stress response protein n=1 Tax=Pararhodobacter oceanensis TaxID=2172121 RepID=A0A2T8HWF6_9RHOB|nr:hypothetical protein [Pararhodobacter oceanensis]PVH29766.1 hypothetical protein DDE20_06570 [Pararhodobacter oceanensis]